MTIGDGREIGVAGLRGEKQGRQLAFVTNSVLKHPAVGLFLGFQHTICFMPYIHALLHISQMQ